MTLKGTKTPQISQNLKYQGISRNRYLGRTQEDCC